jgi:serine/threonine-protein kinase
LAIGRADRRRRNRLLPADPPRLVRQMNASDQPTNIHTREKSSWAVKPERDLTGRTIGDFQVERLLGHGGMGEVYKARQISLDRTVAMKVLRPELVANPTHLARFQKEAFSAAKLNEPTIVHIYTFGEADGVQFIAMEYVEGGKTLKDYMTKKGIPDLPLALSFMRQAAQAIKAAGEIGLVHRDVKPENLLLTRKGQVKVADFGLCRIDAPENVALTAVGTTLGTPMYMSPEQVRGRELDHRSDLYSLGITYYHMLAGVPPFRAETGYALALKHVSEQPVHLAVHRPDLPPDLAAMVMKLIEKDPANRYQNAAEVVREIARIRDSVQAQAGATLPETPAITGVIPASESQEAGATPRASKPFQLSEFSFRLSRKVVFASLAGAILLGALGGYRARSENFLKPSGAGARPETPPGLWMADWSGVEKQNTAEAQYRSALLDAPESEREAAWLAVPGYFGGAKEWREKAYIQLTRTLYHPPDSERLSSLAEELAADGRFQQVELAKVARAAAAALGNDPSDLLESFATTKVEHMPPALAEICLQIVSAALESMPAGDPNRDRLRKIREELRETLQLMPPLRPASPGPR